MARSGSIVTIAGVTPPAAPIVQGAGGGQLRVRLAPAGQSASPLRAERLLRCPAAGACAALYLCRPPASTSIQHTSNPPLTFRSPPLSYVKLAVATYDTLLLSSRPEKSNLLANELVVRTVVKRRT